MKKILFAIAFVMMVIGASAQTDGFFRVNDVEEYDYRTGEANNFNLALPAAHGYENDTNAPLGSGLLMLTALGAGYAIARKKRS